MHTKETMHSVQQILLILQSFVVLVCHLLHLICLLTLGVCKHHSFMECSYNMAAKAVLGFSPGTTVRVIVKVEITVHETTVN